MAVYYIAMDYIFSIYGMDIYRCFFAHTAHAALPAFSPFAQKARKRAHSLRLPRACCARRAAGQNFMPHMHKDHPQKEEARTYTTTALQHTHTGGACHLHAPPMPLNSTWLAGAMPLSSSSLLLSLPHLSITLHLGGMPHTTDGNSLAALRCAHAANTPPLACCDRFRTRHAYALPSARHTGDASRPWTWAISHASCSLTARAVPYHHHCLYPATRCAVGVIRCGTALLVRAGGLMRLRWRTGTTLNQGKTPGW